MFRKPLLNGNLITLHLTVFIWGFTGILGKLISVPSVHLVWYRVLIAIISLFLYFKFTKTDLKVNTQVFIKLFFTGALVGIHWILFFQSIKSSTVSVTMVCLSSLTLFTAILEPLIKRQNISKVETITGLIIITGIYIIFKFESEYTFGIICGLSSAVFASIFSIINSKQIKNRAAPIISFYELTGAWVWISIYLFITGSFNSSMNLDVRDLYYLLILGTLCTSVAYVAGVAVMKELSAFNVALITNLEPVYGIILAFFIFGESEKMTSQFYLGAVIILAAIFLYPVARQIEEKKKFSRKLPLG